MKPQFIRARSETHNSLYVANEKVPFFYNPFHYHNKLELTYIIESVGTRFIGNHMERFKPNELVLVGPLATHCWKNDPDYFLNNSSLTAQAIVVHFDLNFLGEAFWKVPEMNKLQQLLLQSKKGIVFSEKTTKIVSTKLCALEKLKDSRKIITFLEILEHLSNDQDRRVLSSIIAKQDLKDSNLERLNEILNYISNNFTDDISVKQLSEIIHLTPNSFCKYFKKHTRKTFKNYLNEVRIDYACSLIAEEQISMAEVGYRSGFNNISHFMRTFKKIKDTSPLKYKMTLIKNATV